MTQDILTAKEKKDLIVREVLRPRFKEAGYKGSGSLLHSLREDCRVVIGLNGSRFNTEPSGLTLGMEIFILPSDILVKDLRKSLRSAPAIVEAAVLLPDCGYLHPFRRGFDYCIDEYKDYEPCPMGIQALKQRIDGDLVDHVIPQIAEITCLSVGKKKVVEWKERLTSPRVALLRYFDAAHSCYEAKESFQGLNEYLTSFRLDSDTIRDNRALYEQIRKFSPHPSRDVWNYIVESLP